MSALKRTSILFSFFMALGVTAANAQERPTGPWVFNINGGLAAQSSTDLKDEPGSFSVDRWFASAGVNYMWDFRNSVGVSVGGGRTQYDFSDELVFDGQGLWDEIEDYRISMTGRFAFSETGNAIIIPTIRYSGEKGASSSDSQTWGLLAGASWKLSDSLTIGPGLGVFSQLEESTRVFPILIIDWDITERINLSTGRGLAASQGPGLTLSYQAAPDWKLALTGRYEEIEFRLDDTGPAPGGVGRDEVLPLVLSAQWQPNPGMSFSVFGGAEFGGNLELDDTLGNTISSSDYDTAIIYGGTFELRF